MPTIKERHLVILEAIYEKFGKNIWTSREVRDSGIPLDNGALVSLRFNGKITPVDEKGQPQSRAYTRTRSHKDTPQRWRVVGFAHVAERRR